MVRSKWKPYPAYKDSGLPAPRLRQVGVEWLGKIPAHWEVKRLKYATSINDETLPEDTDPNFEIAYVDIGGVDSVKGITEKQTLLFGNAPSRARRVVRDGDVIISTVRTYLRAIAAIESPEPGLIVSTGFAVVRPVGRLISRFAKYALHAPYFVERVVAESVGGSYPAINEGLMGCFPLALPPLEEQRAIAAFLDRETAKIDALVAKKERLIGLLQEKRAALITQGVTKGLDCSMPMKESGVQSLGKIPYHWEVVRIGRKILLQRGVDITREQQSVGDVPVVSSGGVSSFHDRALASGPGVVVGRKGTAGAVYYIEQEFWPHDTTLWVKEFRNNYPRYVFYKLCSMDLASFDTGAANPTLNRNLIHPVFVSWPPVSEQRTIADYLDRETAKIDGLIAKVREGIETLKEYRTVLISAAVTGKIDVRETLADCSQANTRS